MRTRSIVVLALLAAALWLGASRPARAIDLPPLRSTQAPFFSADLAVSVDSAAHSTVMVTLTVPYSEVSWNRVDSGYRAGVGFSVELDPPDHARLYGDAWEKRVLLASYEATRGGRNSMVVTRAFAVPPGRYRVRIRVRDVSTEQESAVEDGLDVRDLSRVPVGFSDLQLGVRDSLGQFLFLPTRQFGYNSGQLAARATFFDRRPGAWPRRPRFHYRVLDETNGTVAQGDTMLNVAAPGQPIVISPGGGDLFIGSYVLELELVEGKSRWRTSRSFEVEESGPPRGRDFDQMLEALAYIADGREIDAMRGLTPEQQAAAWERFWHRHDPTPETPRNEYQIEFFRRLRYANQHFQGFGAGWRSDMGRIYIKFGAPDQVEQQAATSVNPPLEVWYYNQPYHRFIFEDREGFGRYTLRQPSGE